MTRNRPTIDLRLTPALPVAILLAVPATAGAQFFRPPPVFVPRAVPIPHVPVHGAGAATNAAKDDDLVGAALGFTIVAAVVGVLLYRRRAAAKAAGVDAVAAAGQGKPAVMRVRIIATPPGEAPEPVRKAWVGLELPVADGRDGPAPLDAAGVLSGERVEPVEGYEVDGAAAVDLLAAKAPEAAAWWRANAPACVTGGGRLVFPADVCLAVGSGFAGPRARDAA
jgi:hypothetical protein